MEYIFLTSDQYEALPKYSPDGRFSCFACPHDDGFILPISILQMPEYDFVHSFLIEMPTIIIEIEVTDETY